MSEIDDLSELIGKPGESVAVVDAADIYSAPEISAILGALSGKLQAQVAVGLCYFGGLRAPAKPAPPVGRTTTGIFCGSSSRSGGRI